MLRTRARMAAEQTIHLDRYAPDAKTLVASAQSLADERKHAQVEPIHLLARAVERDRGVQEVFRKAGVDPVDVSPLLNALSQEIRGPAAVVLQAFGLGPGSLRPHMAALKSVPRDAPGQAMASAAGAGDVLGRFTHDFVERARRGGFDPVIGRDVEVRRL